MQMPVLVRGHEPILGPRVWQAALVSALERSDEGVALLDDELGVLHCSPRAAHLLARVGMDAYRRLPATVLRVVADQLATVDPTRTDRLAATTGAGGVVLGSRVLRQVVPACIALFVRGDSLRDDALFAVLHERYGMTRRGFQLAQLVREGLTNRQIGERVQLRETTVKVTLHALYRSCGVTSRTSLAALMARHAR